MIEGVLGRENRYTHMLAQDVLEKWASTFVFFDRDGGGDVDIKELGTMFRKLGLTPTEDEMHAMVEAVDDDQSGTIDFEEFCLLMLRCERMAAAPEWLVMLFDDDEEEARRSVARVSELSRSSAHARPRTRSPRTRSRRRTPRRAHARRRRPRRRRRRR